MPTDQVFRLFRQAVRACQLYPALSPAREEALERLARSLEERPRPEGISIAFTDDGTFLDGQPVSELDEAGPPLGRKLFESGLGELRFLPGLTRPELRRLIELLHGAIQGQFNPIDEDLSILLWESELAHVTYWLYGDGRWWEGELGELAFDPQTAGTLESSLATFDPLPDELSDPMAGGADGFVSRPDLTFDVDAFAPQARDDDRRATRARVAYRGTPLLDYLDEEMEPSSETPVLSSCRLTEEERLGLLAAYRQENVVDVPWKYGLLLIEVSRLEEEPEELARISSLLGAYFDALLETGRFALLREFAGVLRAASGVRDAAGDGPPVEVPETVARSLRWFAAPETIARVAQGLGAGASSGSGTTDARDRAAARAWLLDTPADALLAWLEGAEASLTTGVGEVVRARLENDAVFLDLALERGPRQLLEQALTSARELSTERARHVRELARQGPPALRPLAIAALAGASDSASLTFLAESLEHGSPEHRVVAARALARRGGARALEPLLRAVVARDFARRAPDEQRALLVAAGQTSPQEVWPVLARMAEARSFWPTGKLPERARIALDALAALGPEAREFVRGRWHPRRRDLLRRFEVLTTSVDPPVQRAA